MNTVGLRCKVIEETISEEQEKKGKLKKEMKRKVHAMFIVLFVVGAIR